MADYHGRRVFRAPGWIWFAVGFSTLLCATGTAFLLWQGGSWFITASAALMTLVGVGGLLECLVSRVELLDDAILVRSLFSRRRYPREQVEGVAEAKGVAPALKLAGGEWAKVPEVIGGGLGNSVRAWLRAGR